MSSSNMTKHTLTYFGIMGRGEPIRLAFVLGDTPFYNKSISFSEFPALKSELPSGQLPIIEIQDSKDQQTIVMDQSNAILRYVGQLTGLYPSDPIQALAVDAVIDTVEEASKFIGFSMGGPKGFFHGEESLTDDQKREIRKKIMDPSIAKNTAYVSSKMVGLFSNRQSCSHPALKFLNVLERTLDKTGTGWFVGDQPTIADLRAHQLVSWLTMGILDGIPTTSMDAYPLVKAVHDKIEGLPKVVAFRKEHGQRYKSFDYVPKPI